MSQNKPKIIAGRYVLQEIMQSGGMTTVYQGRDILTDNPVAIKRFDRDLHLPIIEREAFRREVEALTNLKHPNILRILDSGEDEEEKYFVVLELMRHDLLAERDNEGFAFAGWDDFADLVILPLLKALTHAHEKSIAHRDVKPANVLVSSDGIIKLADFGISKLKRTLHPRETLGHFMSPPFAPPEDDLGEYTYARDVYSVGMLCLWALSDVPIQDLANIDHALHEFDAPPEIVKIIRRAVSAQPENRQNSAALLATEIENVQAKRRQGWTLHDRARCTLKLTRNALEAARDEFGFDSKEQISQFIKYDINSNSYIRRFIEHPGKMDERIRPEHYSVLGDNFRYHLAVGNSGFESFALLNIGQPDQRFIERDREKSAPCPLTFELDASAGIIDRDEAVIILETSIERFEEDIKEENRRNRETALFNTWIRVLDAKLHYEREQSKSVSFFDASMNGSLVTLRTHDSTEGIEIGEARVLDAGKGHFVRGEVWSVLPDAVVMNCPDVTESELPLRGELKLDLHATQVAVSRQQAAIDKIRAGVTPSNKLKELILDPSSTMIPNCDIILSQDVEEMLDESKCDALKAVLGCEDILVLEGPPGTGKTHFIVALIIEELRRNPAARILLSSQTHVAIDNALERLTDHKDQMHILRIARETSGVVSESVEPFLLDQQAKAWRLEVRERMKEGIQRWAVNNNVDPMNVQVGTLIEQIALTKDGIKQVQGRIKHENTKMGGLKKQKQQMSSIDYKTEESQIGDELDNLRVKLKRHKYTLNELQDELVHVQPDAKQLLEESTSEQLDWASALLGDSEPEQLAKRLMKTQSDWLERFGAGGEFVQPLLERSSVIASTCVGYSAIEETNNVDIDICIIDEASKATAMESCVPMSRSKKWVLVGDHMQLPPFREEVLTQPELRETYDIEASEAGESMFERLRRLLPKENRLKLTTQYRMVQPIGRMISQCFYDGSLDSVRKHIDPFMCSRSGCALNWISTSQLSKRAEERDGTSYINTEEATIICRIIKDLDDALINKVDARKWSGQVQTDT